MLLISFAGSLELYRSPDLVRATGEEPMSDVPDFPKANHALQVLRQARLSRNEAAAIMLADLIYYEESRPEAFGWRCDCWCLVISGPLPRSCPRTMRPPSEAD
jgi:hypothetical protein